MLLKLVRDPISYVFLIGLFSEIITIVILDGNRWGLKVKDQYQIVAEAFLLICATFIGVSLPLYANSEDDRKRKENEIRDVYISVAQFIGEELMDNKGLIDDTIEVNNKTFSQMENYSGITERDKKMIQVNVWKAAADDLLLNLRDDQYKGMINSGIFTKIPDNKMRSDIKNAHTQMIKLKSRLQRMSLFFGELIYPPPNVSLQFIDQMLETRLPESISATKSDIGHFLKMAQEAIIEINKTIKPYDLVVEEVFEP